MQEYALRAKVVSCPWLGAIKQRPAKSAMGTPSAVLGSETNTIRGAGEGMSSVLVAWELHGCRQTAADPEIRPHPDPGRASLSADGSQMELLTNYRYRWAPWSSAAMRHGTRELGALRAPPSTKGGWAGEVGAGTRVLGSWDSP